jgi:hypothetical protein
MERWGPSHSLTHVVSKSMNLMIATASLLFCVPSEVMPLAQVHTSPFLTVNCLSFCTSSGMMRALRPAQPLGDSWRDECG